MGGAGSAFSGNAHSQGYSTGTVGSNAYGSTGSGCPAAGGRSAAGPRSGYVDAVNSGFGGDNHGRVG